MLVSGRGILYTNTVLCICYISVSLMIHGPPVFISKLHKLHTHNPSHFEIWISIEPTGASCAGQQWNNSQNSQKKVWKKKKGLWTNKETNQIYQGSCWLLTVVPQIHTREPIKFTLSSQPTEIFWEVPGFFFSISRSFYLSFGTRFPPPPL